MGAGGLRPGLDLATAADVLYAIGSPETYRHLVVDRGWTGPHFERWYAETLERLLAPPGLGSSPATTKISNSGTRASPSVAMMTHHHLDEDDRPEPDRRRRA